MGLFFALFQRAHQAAIDARRRASTARYLGWSALAAMTLVVALLALMVTAARLWALGLWTVAVGLISVCALPALAPWLVRHVLVPRGQVKLAHLCGRVSSVAGTDSAAFALVAAAWAVLGARKPAKASAVAWLNTRLAERGRLGDAEVVASAFVLARSDVEAARALLASVAEIAEVHPAVRELAGEWLAVDAAERGAWRELATRGDGEGARWPATPLRFFLEGVAARRCGAAAAPSALSLRARWLLAPYRRATWGLLADITPAPASANSSVATTGEVAAETSPPSLSDAVTALLAASVAVETSDRTGAARVHQLALCWDRVLAAPEIHTWMSARAQQLAAPLGSADRALAEVMETVAGAIRAQVERLRLPAPPPLASRFGHLLTAKLRHGRLDELEFGFGQWGDRVTSGRKLTPIDEWREFLAVRQAYRDVVASGGDELRRLAFPRAFEACNRVAVALWNQREEFAIAHAILSWQLAEARAVGDVAAIELSAKNAALPFATRTGRVG